MSDEDSDIPPVAVGDDEPFEIISRYTRAQALDDGGLVDVTAQAKEAGIKIPTAMTRAVWNQYVELTPAAREAGNDMEGRRWDILWMFRAAVLRQPEAREIYFQLNVVTHRIEPSLVTLKAICDPGDDGTPVITLLLPQED
jgi:hypothetical protein